MLATCGELSTSQRRRSQKSPTLRRWHKRFGIAFSFCFYFDMLLSLSASCTKTADISLRAHLCVRAHVCVRACACVGREGKGREGINTQDPHKFSSTQVSHRLVVAQPGSLKHSYNATCPNLTACLDKRSLSDKTSTKTKVETSHDFFCNVWGPGDGPLEMYFEKTRTRRRKREKDSERYSPESGHIRKRYGDWREYLVVR